MRAPPFIGRSSRAGPNPATRREPRRAGLGCPGIQGRERGSRAGKGQREGLGTLQGQAREERPGGSQGRKWGALSHNQKEAAQGSVCGTEEMRDRWAREREVPRDPPYFHVSHAHAHPSH